MSEYWGDGVVHDSITPLLQHSTTPPLRLPPWPEVVKSQIEVARVVQNW